MVVQKGHGNGLSPRLKMAQHANTYMEHDAIMVCNIRGRCLPSYAALSIIGIWRIFPFRPPYNTKVIAGQTNTKRHHRSVESTSKHPPTQVISLYFHSVQLIMLMKGIPFDLFRIGPSAKYG